ncbi:MAG: mannose-1-phosphate guanylyltransferase/mannose-6-phosphate isomerase [Desulfuromonas sp.]|nr:MAG: mannose-1-phosphate guanylyltransferase/mannose-6-phosphate isomerase [Desulfuromonas sp.]
MIVPVILSGGAGTRLWPLSRELYPKQFLDLVSDQTMLQETVSRLAGVSDLAAPLVVCNEEHRFLVAEQLRQIDVAPEAIILEPEGRNTAPAVALAALQALSDEEDPLLLILPADHAIADREAFKEAIESAAVLAAAGSLVTFGIVPDSPETGYGYIRRGDHRGVPVGDFEGYFPVAEFVEKPDRETAQAYVEGGNYLWNSGMFMFRASRYLKELQKFSPVMVESCSEAMQGAVTDLDFTRPVAEAFRACPGDSIDYAVMEKTDAAVVIPLQAGWSDVGSWSSLWAVQEQDEAGNVIRGDVLATDTSNCYLHASGRLVASVGLENHVVVETADAVLVAARDKVQDVRDIVNQLKQLERKETLLHRRVHRPWGTYECIDAGERFQVKRITVAPGASLSMQRHHHRAEHWVVVKGTANVVCGEREFTVSENESTYIPVGELHRLNNPGKIPLEIIEVQSGSYLGEDDIVRVDDVFGRS